MECGKINCVAFTRFTGALLRAGPRTSRQCLGSSVSRKTAEASSQILTFQKPIRRRMSWQQNGQAIYGATPKEFLPSPKATKLTFGYLLDVKSHRGDKVIPPHRSEPVQILALGDFHELLRAAGSK